MNNATNHDSLPSLIGGILSDREIYIDNVFASTWKALNFNKLIKSAGFSKRSGVQITEAVFVLLLWKWLNVSSVGLFARKVMSLFSDAKKDVLYDLLKREDINWREFNLQTAKAVYTKHKMDTEKTKVFVLDDSIKNRRGKKMEGVSSHFDHVTNRHVMGQQVLTLGLATEDAFMPLDSQIFVSQSKAKELNRPYKDGRSVAAKRYQEATEQSKPEMAASMMKRAKRIGITADYVAADAWFGSKQMIRTAMEIDIQAILRMKKGKMKFRMTNCKGRDELLDANQLYTKTVKREWKKVRGLPWKAVSITVELDLSEGTKKTPAEWKTVKLLFVRGLNQPGVPEVGKKDWALFLSTDSEIGDSKILEIYSLRWGIEVYFKEAKQHLGFLAEQTKTFASHTASIHLCAVRYLMLVHSKLEMHGIKIGDVRADIQDQLDAISFAGRLWKIFRAIISGTLHEIENMLPLPVQEMMQAIDLRVNEFFTRSLQLDSFTMQLEHD